LFAIYYVIFEVQMGDFQEV